MYVKDGGKEMCGFYECKECGNRFLSLKIEP
jgi:DNA-directed RNA polymerase subunit M/transcription elongation factor TFIIS